METTSWVLILASVVYWCFLPEKHRTVSLGKWSFRRQDILFPDAKEFSSSVHVIYNLVMIWKVSSWFFHKDANLQRRSLWDFLRHEKTDMAHRKILPKVTEPKSYVKSRFQYEISLRNVYWVLKKNICKNGSGMDLIWLSLSTKYYSFSS